eukprot:GHVN01058218.1.p2 GENE.GHVN01058218.1~~GHVN01058218.1.p2  ORF type:complete len:248 (+),score=43.45 GHVN01058218.1:1109-1852(+)
MGLSDVWGIVTHYQEKGESVGTPLLNSILLTYTQSGFGEYAVKMIEQYSVFKCDCNIETFKPLLEMFGKDLKDPGRFSVIWRQMVDDWGVVPSSPLVHLALDVALLSRSPKQTLAVLKEMQSMKIFPSPDQAEKLASVAGGVPTIRQHMNTLIEVQAVTTARRLRVDSNKHQLKLIEASIRLHKEGKKVGDPTEAQEVMNERNESRKMWRRKNKIPSHSFEEKQLRRAKGGELYSQRVDKPTRHLNA